MNNYLWILFPSILFTSVISYDKYLIFPTVIFYKVKRFDLDFFSCDPVKNNHQGLPISLNISIPFLEFSTVGGYFCKKINHRITCESGLDGFKFINTNHPQPIKSDECKDAISKLNVMNNQPVGLNYPKCAIYSTHIADNSRIDTEYQLIPFNKLDGSLIHHYFTTGSCKTQYCPTVHPNIYWIGDSTTTQHCSQLTTSTAKLYLDEYNSIDYSLIDTVYTPPLPLGDACKNLHYCGMNSYVLKDGSLIIPSDNNSKLLLEKLGTKLKPCKNTTLIKEVTAYNFAINQDLHTLISFHIEQCESAIYRIKKSNKIVMNDLIYLSDIYPGKGFGYYLSPNGSVEKYNVNLERIHDMQVNCSTMTNCNITFLKPGYNERFTLPKRCFEPTVYLKSFGIICMWLNGIGFSADKVHYPHAYFSQLINEDYMRALAPNNVYHPVTSRTDNDTSIDNDKEFAKSETTSVSIWDYFVNKITWISGVIGGVTILFISICFIKFVMSKRVTSSPQINIYSRDPTTKSINIENSKSKHNRKTSEMELKSVKLQQDQSSHNMKKHHQSKMTSNFL